MPDDPVDRHPPGRHQIDEDRGLDVRPTDSGDTPLLGIGRRGLISRRRDPDNRRVVLISLTDTGHELLATYDEAVNALEERMLSGLTADQRRDLTASLNRCRAALSEVPPH